MPTEYVAIIYPTAWGLLATDIVGMWEKLQHHEDAHGIMSVVRPLEHPTGALELDDFGHAVFLRPRYTNGVDKEGWLRERQKHPLVMDAGYCYIYRVSAFKKRGFYPENLLGYELPRERVVDINYPEDFRIARRLYNPHVKE